MHFGENQLSRSLIGLSPLPTAHPLSFQPKWVRASTTSYSCFTLAMGRSPRFGSRTCHLPPYSDSLSLRLPHKNGLTSRHAADSQAHSSKGTPSHTKDALTDCKRMVSGTLSLPSRGTFHHSLTVLSTIGHTEYLGLPGGPGRFTADSTSPLLLGEKTQTTQPHTPSRTGLITYSGAPSQMLPLICAHRACSRQPATFTPHNTAHATPARYHTHTV